MLECLHIQMFLLTLWANSYGAYENTEYEHSKANSIYKTYPLMTITEKINQIIDQRIGRNEYEGKGRLSAIRAKKAFFNELLKLLNDYEGLRGNILSQIESCRGEYFMMSTEDPTFKDNVIATDTSALKLMVEKCLKECDRLEKRFNRDSINISVVGRARQGKSRLLQSISGLSNEVIPASDGGDCTGAKSVIFNSAGNTHAKVVFYNEIEMVEQVQKYLDAISIPCLLGSLGNIKNLTSEINAFEKDLINKSGGSNSLFLHLKKYVEHYDDYAAYIGQTIDLPDEKDIRKYVAQYDADMKPTYAFLAVKEVQIFTEFPVKDAGKIVLVDTIGLGDTSLGIREKMITTLREDSDAAILVRLPNPNGDNIRVEDDELYDLIREAMGTEALSKWLFFALNVCDELKNQNSGNAMEIALNQRALNYAFIKKTNCGDRKSVEDELLMPILNFLAANLSQVDGSLMKKANQLFNECYNSYYNFCLKVSNILSGSFKKNLESGGLFDDLWEDNLLLTRKLNELKTKYSDRNKKCDLIFNEVRRVIRNIAKHCPKKEVILDRLTAGGEKGHAHNAYNYYADNLRAEIREEFEEISRSTVTTLQDDFKREVCETLRSDEGGRLAKVPMQTDYKDDMDWLAHFIEEKLKNYPILENALNDILNFRLNIEGSIEYKADMALTCLDSNNQNKRFVVPNFQGLSNDEIASVIEQTLLSTIPIVADEMMEGVKDLLSIPYYLFCARIQKLYDRLIFKRDGNRELKNFYRKYAPAIWPQEFKNIANKEVALGQLNDYHNRLNELRKRELFVLTIN